MTTDQFTQRRDELLTQARAIATKAQTEGRDLSVSENDQVQAALSEARSINERIAADASVEAAARQARRHGPRQLSAAGDDTRRLCFTKGMAEQAAAAIMPASTLGTKALAPSGATVMAQQFDTDPIVLGQPATNVVDVFPVTVQPSQSLRILTSNR